MQWEFTADEVVRGEVGYGLAEFRRDLLEEARGNLGDDEALLRHGFDAIYDLCHWLATGRDFAAFVAERAAQGPFDAPTLHAIRAHMGDNVTMLGAILQRGIMDGVEQGMTLEAAVAQAAAAHAAIAAVWPDRKG